MNVDHANVGALSVTELTSVTEMMQLNLFDGFEVSGLVASCNLQRL